MAKIIVSIDHAVTDDTRAKIVKRVADSLGVLPEDVVLVPVGVLVSVVEVPSELVKAREKKDAQDKHEAEQKAKEEAKEEAKPTHSHTTHSHAKVKE